MNLERTALGRNILGVATSIVVVPISIIALVAFVYSINYIMVAIYISVYSVLTIGN